MLLSGAGFVSVWDRSIHIFFISYMEVLEVDDTIYQRILSTSENDGQ